MEQSHTRLVKLLGFALIICFGALAYVTSLYFSLIKKPLINGPQSATQTTPVLTPTSIITPTQNPIQTPTSTPTLLIQDTQKYTDTKFGFTLEFPNTWKSYVVTTNNQNGYSVGFSFKDPHQPFTIFQIYHYTKSQWIGLQKNPMTKLIEQSDGSVFACDGCCKSSGNFTGGGQFDQFQIDRCKEVPEILKTFSL